MGQVVNLDLLTVGIAIAGNLILGLVVFLQQKKNATGILFFLLSVALSLWSAVNYTSYQISDERLALWLVRLVMFFATPIGALFLLLIDAFPREKLRMSRRYMVTIIFFSVVTMVLTLTPFIFEKVTLVEGEAPHPTIGAGIVSFIIVPVFAIVLGIILLIKRTLITSGLERKQYKFLALGVAIMFFLILILNFIFPSFLKNTTFIPFSAIFTFPFVAFTAYAILKHHLLGVRVIATEILTFLLTVVTLYEVILSEGLTFIILRSGIFLTVLGFGILLIRSVRREVEQRERMEKMTAELEHVNERLKELDHLKSEFLNFASHQVKSPMATVKGFATLIEDGTYGAVSDQAKEGAHRIRGAADRLISLVNNLLDLGKIEAGKLDFTMQDMDIVKLIATMVDEYQILAQNKKLLLTFESDKPSLTIKADAEKLRQVIQNLIDNAIKYTDAGWVKVAFKDEYEKNTVLISVMDSGRGMSPELLQKLFGRFVRDEKTKTEVMGTGLGLYIAKQIVLAHHGEIWAESEGVSKGSKFFVKLAKG